MVLDKLSNNEEVLIEDRWIDEAVEAFRASLIKQLRPEPREFGLRASNVGRPVCQLQNEQAGIPKTRQDYNHIMRMLLGDITEIVVRLMVMASGANVTGEKAKSETQIGSTLIKGEDDIEIDAKVYDVKSASPYMFTHKWADGWKGIYYGDSFGYVPQLYMYARGDPKRMGGWIVVDKSSGEIKVVPAEPTPEQIKEIKAKIEETERIIAEQQPFRKVFQAEEETWYGKATGNLKVPLVCTFCQFQKHCWPEAVYRTNPSSKAQSPKPQWYVKVKGE